MDPRDRAPCTEAAHKVTFPLCSRTSVAKADSQKKPFIAALKQLRHPS